MRVRGEPRHRIVVGIDGSDASLHAVRWAVVQARLRMATVELVHVGDEGEASDALLAHAVEVVEAADVDELDVTTAVVEGDTVARLVERAERADLLVIAKGGVVCAAVVAAARCPVVVVPPSRRADARG